MPLGLVFRVFILCVTLNTGVAYAAGIVEPEMSPVRFVTQHFPPFSYIEQGQVAGPARVLIDAVCEALDQRCDHQLLPWERGQRLVELGEAEAMYVIGWNPERDRRLRFSSALLSTEYGFFVRGDDPLHQLTPGALAGYQVAVLGASNTLNSLASLQPEHRFEIIEVTDSDAAFRLLSVGRVTAVYSNREVGRALINQIQLTELHYALKHRQLDYFVGFNPNGVSADWVDRFNRQLQQLQQRGEAKQLMLRFGLE